MKTYRSYSSAETKNFGRQLAAEIAKRPDFVRALRDYKIEDPRYRKAIPGQKVKSTALVFALTGDLGSGKTTFVQGFLRALGVRKKITSPTFVLVKRYATGHMQYAHCYHVDAYRLKSPRDLEILGFEEILSDPQNIVLIEWAEKIKKLLPENTTWIKFDHRGKHSERKIRIK